MGRDILVRPEKDTKLYLSQEKEFTCSRISQHGYCQEKRNYICKFPNDRGKVVVTKVERRQKISTTQPISLQKSHCDTITFLVVGVRISSEKRE